MIKNYLTILAFSATAGLYAQADVTLKVDDRNNKTKTAIKFKGQFNSWTEVSAYDDGTNGDATAKDNIWSLKVAGVANGTYEWGAVDQTGAWLTPGVPNYKFTVASGAVSGQTEIVIPKTKPMHPVVFTVRDLAKKESGVKLKGAMFGWSSKDMFDDGTNGDTTAGDKVWTLKTDVEEGSFEWGIENQCGWKLVGPNRQFTVAVGGAVSGSVSYSIPALTTPINVTFRVYMGDVIVNSSGLYIAGNFMDAVSGKSLCNWSKDTLRLTDADKNDVYELTVSMSPGNYAYKYFNGRGGDPDGEKGDFKTGGCGSDNGLGGFNRNIDLSKATAAVIVDIYKYDSCVVYKLPTTGIKKSNNVFKGIYPNPATASANVSFTNKNLAHTVEVMDISGKVVAKNNFAAGVNYGTIMKHAAGTYFVKVTAADGSSATSTLVFE
ncbi:MAG: T9SS type A sorting domain-containing protein [Sphingomonadales bacterium]